MPERPLLILPSPGAPLPRQKRKASGGGGIRGPGRSRQAERLDAGFERLRAPFEERRMSLREESHDLVPEEVVVLDIRGSVDDFARAVDRVEGLEWLLEIETEDAEPDEDFLEPGRDGTSRPDRLLRSRLFLVSSNQQGLEELLALWKRWKKGGRFERGMAKWSQVFDRLHDPSGLLGKRCRRRLIVTLAWFSPVNPADQRWRRARLWFAMPDNFLNVNRKNADWQAVKRGTLQHEIFEGDAPLDWDGDRDLEIEVSCRADAGTLEEEVPYALAATLEIAEGVFAANLYDEVRQRLRAARQRVGIQQVTGSAANAL